MNILFRYLLKEFLNALLFTVLVFVGLYCIAELVDDMRAFVEHHPAASLIIMYYFYRIPYYFVQILPLSILLASLFSLGQLGRSNELIAMRASGISFFKVALPIICAAATLVGFVFIFNEIVIPYTNPRAHYIWKVQIEGKPVENFEFRRDWMTRSVSGNRILHARHLDALGGKMTGVIFLQMSDKLKIQERIDAPEATWQNGLWIFRNGVQRTFDPEGNLIDFKHFIELPIMFREIPKDFIKPKMEEDQILSIPLRELKNEINLLREMGTDPLVEEVNFHLKIAFPFANLILALLGVSLPFIFPTGHRAIVWTAIGFVITLVAGFFYIGFIAVGSSFGKSGIIPAMLSVWISNLFFGGLGIFLMFKAKS